MDVDGGDELLAPSVEVVPSINGINLNHHSHTVLSSNRTGKT